MQAQPRVSEEGNTFDKRREYICLSDGAVTGVAAEATRHGWSKELQGKSCLQIYVKVNTFVSLC